MQSKVLIIEQHPSTRRLLHRLASKAQLDPVVTASLTEARYVFTHSNPEQFLCAIVDYHLPDAPSGEAIDYTIDHYIPTIVTTAQPDEAIRQYALGKEVVDYIPKENAQIYDYLSRLLNRLDKNKTTGVLVVDPQRRSRNHLRALLQRHHFIIYTCSTGAEAMQRLSQGVNIKLMLVDNRLSDVPATQLIANVRQKFGREELAILGLCADENDLLSAKFIKSGANDFIRKPFCYESFFCRINLNIEVIELIDTIQRTANTDYLTGLANRRHFFSQITKLNKHSDSPSALALFDLDHFKRINDTYGHDAGDAVLKAVANMLKQHFAQELVSRFGGEEFCVYFAGESSTTAFSRLQGFCRQLASTAIATGHHSLQITTSVGLTLGHSQSIETMLSSADKLLYQAKSAGRNQIIFDN